MTTPYHKTELKLPRLAGTSLRAFIAALDVPGLGDLLRAQMLGNIGVPALRAAPCDEPQWTPLRLATADSGAPWPTVDVERLLRPAANGGLPTIGDYARAFRDGKRTPVDVAEAAIAAIAASEQTTPAMRVFIAHDPDDVRRQARESLERHKQGKPRSFLDGVPVTVKDEVDMLGYPTTAGTRFLGKHKAVDDSEPVRRLRAAGAVLLGKANMHELGIGTTGINPHHGTPRNPHDLSRATGGSSSGSGAAVAAGLSPLALGADGGGSIRNPAALCGVFGLKPTFGRVSERGAAAICWTLAHIGPLATSARDLALGLSVMGGVDDAEPGTHQQAPLVIPDLDADLRGKKIGVWRPWFEDADPGVVQACWAGVRRLEQAGATVVDVEVPHLEHMRVIHVLSILLEMATSQLSLWSEHKGDYALDTRLNFAMAYELSSVDYLHAQRHRTALCQSFERALDGVDVIATPSVGCTAPTIRPDALSGGESDIVTLLKIMRYAPAANVTGLPAISIPVDDGEHAMPASLMLMGRPWQEGELVHFAAAHERAFTPKVPKHHWRLL